MLHLSIRQSGHNISTQDPAHAVPQPDIFKVASVLNGPVYEVIVPWPNGQKAPRLHAAVGGFALGDIDTDAYDGTSVYDQMFRAAKADPFELIRMRLRSSEWADRVDRLVTPRLLDGLVVWDLHQSCRYHGPATGDRRQEQHPVAAGLKLLGA